MKQGALCISLDFEKYWGVHDISLGPNQIDAFKHVSEVVNGLLSLFDQYNIHSTWAVVGLLNFDSLAALEQHTQEMSIPYHTKQYNPFPISKHDLHRLSDHIFSGQKDIEKIQNSLGQELASHTFSHFYALETGQTITDFKHDIKAFNTYVSASVSSIVFPRNQVNTAYLKCCYENGITAYRGNQKHWFWRNEAYAKESVFKRIIRTLDAYINLSQPHLTDWKDIKKIPDQPLNLPASRFLKPARYPNWIEYFKLRRIKREMTKAAKTKTIYHLWWHPHNFTQNTSKNFKQLEAILKHQNDLNSTYGFNSLNMNEIASTLD